MNIEAYGGPTDLPWRMGIYEYVGGALQYAEVHPTFLYESLWNLLGLILLAVIAQKWRKFDGQMFLSYFAWYGVGRGCIEGLRTDSLYFFNTTVRVSQVFGFATAAVAIVLLREFAVSGMRLVAVEQGRVIAAAWSGKVKTASTMVCLCAMLLNVFGAYAWFDPMCNAVIVLTTAYSGIEYFIKNADVFREPD